MKHWPVGLRPYKGKWFAATLSDDGIAECETVEGWDTPSEAVENLEKIRKAQNEPEDWQAYWQARTRVW